MNLQFIKKHKGLLASLGVSLIFLLAAAWQLYFEEEYTLALIPLGLLFLWFLIQRFDTMLLCMALCTPFSINMDVTHELTLTVPTEPLMILFTALFAVIDCFTLFSAGRFYSDFTPLAAVYL